MSRWKAMGITAPRQQYRKEKGKRLTRQLRWKAASERMATGTHTKVKKALVHVDVQQLTCLALAAQC